MAPAPRYSFTFHPTTDYGQVRAIFVHPRVFPLISDDFTPAPAEYQVPEHPAILYLLARDHGRLLGVWMFAPENAISWQVHTALLPHAWGARAREAGKACAKWIWENTICQRIWTEVPESNRAALVFAKWTGMKEFGRNPQSIQKGGVLQDQILLGMTRPQE